MADAASPDLVAILAPVVIGGAIGLAGGWLGPWLLERRKERAEKEKRRSEKFEDMVAALFEYDHYMDVVRDIMLYTKVGELMETEPASPFAKLHAISAVYFPEFEKKISELEIAGSKYRVWLVNARQKFVNGEYKTYIDGYKEAYEPFGKVVRGLLEEFKKFARAEFQ